MHEAKKTKCERHAKNMGREKEEKLVLGSSEGVGIQESRDWNWLGKENVFVT